MFADRQRDDNKIGPKIDRGLTGLLGVLEKSPDERPTTYGLR